MAAWAWRTVALIALLVSISSVDSFSSTAGNVPKPSAPTTAATTVADDDHDDHGAASAAATEDRPLLRRFSRGIRRRIQDSADGPCRPGAEGAYTSDETIPCLDMTTGAWTAGDGGAGGFSSRGAIRRAFAESSRIHASNGRDAVRDDEAAGGDRDRSRRRPGNRGPAAPAAALPHGRSTGSGCSLVRVFGSDASSVLGLADYGDDFFCRVDGDGDEAGARAASAVRGAGIIRIADHCYAGFDGDVNDEGRMQFLDARFVPSGGDTPPDASAVRGGQPGGESEPRRRAQRHGRPLGPWDANHLGRAWDGRRLVRQARG